LPHRQTGPGTILIARNDGAGNFDVIDPILTVSEIVGPTVSIDRPSCRDIAMNDINGDGSPDIVATVDAGLASAAMLLYMENSNDGSGTFRDFEIITDQRLGGGRSLCEIQDMDQEGLPDIAIVNDDVETVIIYDQESDGNFLLKSVDFEPGAKIPDSLTLGDISGNGFADIITYSTHGMNVYWNQGDREFERLEVFRTGFVNSVSNFHGLVYDLNGDGLNDILASQASYLGISYFEQIAPI